MNHNWTRNVLEISYNHNGSGQTVTEWKYSNIKHSKSCNYETNLWKRGFLVRFQFDYGPDTFFRPIMKKILLDLACFCYTYLVSQKWTSFSHIIDSLNSAIVRFIICASYLEFTGITSVLIGITSLRPLNLDLNANLTLQYQGPFWKLRASVRFFRKRARKC